MYNIILSFIKKPLGLLGSCIIISISTGIIIFDHFNFIDINLIFQYFKTVYTPLTNQEIIINQENQRLLGILGIDVSTLPLDVKNQILRLFREHPNEIPIVEIQRLINQHQNIIPVTPEELPSLAVKSPDVEYLSGNFTETSLNNNLIGKK